MTNEQMLNSIPTVDLIRALIRRDEYVIVANTVGDKYNTSMILIREEEPNGEIMKVCSKRWTELNQEVACNE